MNVTPDAALDGYDIDVQAASLELQEACEFLLPGFQALQLFQNACRQGPDLRPYQFGEMGEEFGVVSIFASLSNRFREFFDAAPGDKGEGQSRGGQRSGDAQFHSTLRFKNNDFRLN